jgi:hypothetical protein
VLHENQQRVAADLTNRDLKLTPPPGLAAQDLATWLSIKPDSVTIIRDGKSVTLTGEALVRWKYQRYMQDYLATVQSVDDSVGRVLEVRDNDQLANEQLPNGVDDSVARLRGRDGPNNLIVEGCSIIIGPPRDGFLALSRQAGLPCTRSAPADVEEL